MFGVLFWGDGGGVYKGERNGVRVFWKIYKDS